MTNGDPDPLLTVAEVAARLDIKPVTWRSYVSRGTAPPPDAPDLGRPEARRAPRWLTSTIDAWAPSRRPPGRPRAATVEAQQP